MLAPQLQKQHVDTTMHPEKATRQEARKRNSVAFLQRRMCIIQSLKPQYNPKQSTQQAAQAGSAFPG